MQHQGTRRLETERLILRRFAVEDAGAMFRNWACDAQVTKFLTWPAHIGADISRWVLMDWTGRYEKPEYYQWAIELKAIGEPIGSISVVRMEEQVDECELGWCIGRPWWGQGIVAEAGAAVLRFLFEEVKANRVAARHAVENPNSGRVMQKLGMVKEGVLRQAGRSNQGLEDLVQYSMLASEYFAARAADEKSP